MDAGKMSANVSCQPSSTDDHFCHVELVIFELVTATTIQYILGFCFIYILKALDV